MDERLDPTDRVLSPQSHSSGSETLLGQDTIDSQVTSTVINAGPIVQNVALAQANPSRAGANENAARDDPFKTPESEPEKEEPQVPPEAPGVPEKRRRILDKKRFAINTAVTLGFLAWIFQWMFWAGFAYTSGQRFAYFQPNLTLEFRLTDNIDSVHQHYFHW